MTIIRCVCCDVLLAAINAGQEIRYEWCPTCESECGVEHKEPVYETADLGGES